MHIDLHWLDVLERVTYKLIVMVYHCLHGTAPKYLSELYTLVADVASRRQLRSASQNVLLVPRYKLSGLGRRTCANELHSSSPWISWWLSTP